MELLAFRRSLSGDEPPTDIGRALAALWHEAKGDWHRAHRLAQEEKSDAGAWAHAYLHRVEGDESNAAYWYRRAGKPFCELALEEEWRQIADALLSDTPR